MQTLTVETGAVRRRVELGHRAKAVRGAVTSSRRRVTRNRSGGLTAGSGQERRGDRLPVLVGGDRGGEVGMQPAALQAAGLADRE